MNARRLNALLLTTIGAASAWLPRVASAQEHDPAAAQALFDQARELSKQGRYAEACPKLQESNRLDPGVGTRFYLADCYEQSGRVASAWAAFLEVESQMRAGGQLDTAKVAHERAEKLAPRLPRLVLEVPEASRASGLEVRRNGILIGAAQWGAAVPVDPGEVELTASAPGKRTLRQALRLEEGKTANYTLPALVAGEAVESAPAAQPLGSPPAKPQPAPSAPPLEAKADSGAHKNVGWVVALAGAGVVGLGVSTTFAILAKNKDADSKTHCSQPNTCNATGVTLRNDAIQKGNVATVAAVAGGIGIVGAAVVWVLSGTSSEERRASGSSLRVGADVAASRGAFYLQGSF